MIAFQSSHDACEVSMAEERRIEVLEPGGSIHPWTARMRERTADSPPLPLGVPWTRLVVVFALGLAMWLLIGEAAVVLFG
jgi:hypothetical protein